jgi:hypothetical protein
MVSSTRAGGTPAAGRRHHLGHAGALDRSHALLAQLLHAGHHAVRLARHHHVARGEHLGRERDLLAARRSDVEPAGNEVALALAQGRDQVAPVAQGDHLQLQVMQLAEGLEHLAVEAHPRLLGQEVVGLVAHHAQHAQRAAGLHLRQVSEGRGQQGQCEDGVHGSSRVRLRGRA